MSVFYKIKGYIKRVEFNRNDRKLFNQTNCLILLKKLRTDNYFNNDFLIYLYLFILFYQNNLYLRSALKNYKKQKCYFSLYSFINFI